MKKFHRLCETIVVIAIYNFLLAFFLALILGGDGASGKVEGGHYYLGNHGDYREVHPAIFWFSKCQIYSLLVTHLLAMLAGLPYAITGGKGYSSTSSYLIPRSQNKFLRTITRFHWNVVDFIEEIIWIFPDCWRKPDGEWFVHRSRKECVQALRRLNANYLSTGQLERPIAGFFSGNHFYLQNWYATAFPLDWGCLGAREG